MREIKFRAWDKKRKEWVKQTGNPYIFPFKGRVAMKCWGDESGYISDEDYSEFYDLEQFTGLRDKSGKEIYEGDIVTSHNGALMGTVLFQAPSFIIKKTPRHAEWYEFILSPEQNQLQEVIGNIHENPELLKP